MVQKQGHLGIETAFILNTNPCIASDFWKKQKISSILQPQFSREDGIFRGFSPYNGCGPSSGTAKSLPRTLELPVGKIFDPAVEFSGVWGYDNVIKPPGKENVMKGLLWIALFVGVYLLLQIYVLPKMGIST